MNKCKVIFLALLACAFGASARTITFEEAQRAASGWAQTGTAMGLRLPTKVASAAEYSVTNGYKFYEVKMAGGGTVFLTSDTEFAPVIGFSAKGNLDLSAGSKLRKILEGDIALRAAMKSGTASPALRMTAASATQTTASATQTTAASTTASESETLWAALLKRSQPSLKMSTAASPATSVVQPTVDVDDVCVAPLVETQWSQTTHNDSKDGYKCYNYYTPDGDPCGCTATALSQIMRYFRYPTAELAPQDFSCTVEGEATTLTTLGGIYDWAKMAPKPATTNDDAVFEAIGRLTYDAGVALKSDYTSGETSAVLYDAPDALKGYFGYASAFCFFDDAAWAKRWPLHTQTTIEKVIYANLDARRPVELGVYGYSRDGWHQWGGHAIVGDGYGYKTVSDVRTPFVHLNLGWSGNDDMWYNLPTIRTGTGIVPGGPAYDFDYLGMALFNIVPEGEDAGKEILSGRTVDPWGEVVSNAVVTVRLGDSVVATTVSDEHGIYAFALAGGNTYDVSAVSEDGKQLGRRDPVTLGTTKGDAHGVVASVGNVGNSWGNDIEVANPVARIGAVEFTRLSAALKAVQEGDVVEILCPAWLDEPVTIASNCTVFATNENASASSVTRMDGAALTIADGATATLSNVVFSASEETLITVAAGGCLTLGDGVDLGVGYDEGVAVVTADAAGFALAGVPVGKFQLRCAAAKKEPQVFGSYVCDQTVAETAAEMILCADDSMRETRGQADGAGQLYWKVTSVPLDEAAGYYVDKNGVTNAYARIDRVFELFENAMKAGTLSAESNLVLRKSGTLSRAVTISAPAVISGEEGVVVEPSGTASFTIPTGGELTLSNLVFTGYHDADDTNVSGFLYVNGGKLALASGTVLSNLTGCVDMGSGIIDLNAGTMTMRKGSSIINCRAEGGSGKGGYGGAVYVNLSPDCVLNLEGGVISNCWASLYGGGVYVDYWNETWCPTVNLSGRLIVADNWSDNNPSGDDIHVASAKAVSRMRLVDDIEGSVGIWYASSVAVPGVGNEDGDAFVTNAVGVVKRGTLTAFFNNDTEDALVAVTNSAGMLVWEKWLDDGTCPDPALASAHVHQLDASGKEISLKHYYDLATALAYMEPGTRNRIEMFIDGFVDEPFSKDMTVPSGCQVLLMSPNADGYGFLRDDDAAIVVSEGASLTLSNVTFDVGINGFTNPYFDVVGGALTLDAGVKVRSGTGNTYRNANGITVRDRGVFTMLEGAEISHCFNSYNEDKTDDTVSSQHHGVGGGLLLEGGSVAYLRGGKINQCRATRGGGVCACNNSKVYVSCGVKLTGNKWLLRNGRDGGDSNLVIDENSELYLDGELTGKVGTGDFISWGLRDTNVAAKVSYDWTSAVEALAASATNFTHDVLGDVGVAVTNGTKALIVWCGAVKNGVYTNVEDDVSVEYVLVGEMPVVVNPEPPQAALLPELDGDADMGTVAKELGKLADERVAEKITTLDDYKDFRQWAYQTIQDVDAVATSNTAYVSYQFGTQELLDGDPVVEITQVENIDGGLKVRVTVRDGEDPVAVASEKVKEMFEASSDMGDWSKKLDLTVTDLSQTTANEVEFSVKPAGDPAAAFIRLKY